MTPAAEGGRARSPRRRQLEVLEAAARVFAAKGYEATSIQDIADEVGILKGSLYYYIRSKEDLLFDILEDVHEQALAALAPVAGMDGDALQRIRAFVSAHLAFVADQRTKLAVLRDVHVLADEQRGALTAAQERYAALLRGLLRDGQAERTVCPELDADRAALAVLGLLGGGSRLADTAGPRLSAELADLVVCGVACTPETHAPGHRARLGSVA